MYNNKKVFEKTFDWDGLPEYLRQAQWAEFIELKKVISEISNRLGRPIKILDIGVGDGRLLKHLMPIEEIWNKIESYDGIDNTQVCVDATNKLIFEAEIPGKVSVLLLDATKLSELNKTYDLIFTTWFTGGNFFPDSFDFANYAALPTLDLTHNKKFTDILSSAYNFLNLEGEIVLGSLYIENDETRKKQESFYTYFGMEVITSSEDSFTATKEGFWSQRFTPEKVERYLQNIPKEQLNFIPLDTYDFAMMVRIAKV